MTDEAVDVVDAEASEPESSDGAATLSTDQMLRAVLEGLETLTQRINIIETRPNTLPLTQSPESILDTIKTMTAGQSKFGHDVIDPGARFGLRTKYRPDDVVRLIDSEKIALYRKAGKLGADEDMLGVVQALMYRRRRDGECKYRIAFPSMGRGSRGQDGVMEVDLELVQAAPR